MDFLDEADVASRVMDAAARRVPWIRRTRAAIACAVSLGLALRTPVVVALVVATALAFVAAGAAWGIRDLLPALRHAALIRTTTG